MTSDSPMPRRPRLTSPIIRRILAINVLALAILVAGLLYLGQYRDSLVASELSALRVHAEILAAALGESAAEDIPTGRQLLRPRVAVSMVQRLVQTTGGRARLFAPDGVLIADTQRSSQRRNTVERETLPPPGDENPVNTTIVSKALDIFEHFLTLLPGRGAMPPYLEKTFQQAEDYPEVVSALSAESGYAVRSTSGGDMVLSVAVPVQRYKQVLGALMLTRNSDNIEQALREVRINILKVFAVALGVTILLSLYLAGTIARPVRHLAEAAERVRHGHHRQHEIPDFAARGDEIGELSRSLKDMTEALWQRMDAIESFAADVAHEIKNPLTSLRSAVETAARVNDPEQQKKLMDIILDDVERMDRLISDISDASRLDAELSKAETRPVNVSKLLTSLVDARNEMTGGHIKFICQGDMVIASIESRLGQVFANLLTNALSFSPAEGSISIEASDLGNQISITFDDEGPGLPEGKLETVFERFYTQRPEAEKFGTHSGLGLSISRQIVETHHGSITAENRVDGNGDIIGARFKITLPKG
ncbi:MAG: stimulus-sensing domain-containing protein [Rhodospirillales bacterium]|nr:stimulus-sensing domain-containing protein [Rhodospirillales bacterium]